MPDVSAFVATMPTEYRTAFSERAHAEHAAIAATRGDRAAIVARWSGDRDGATAVCVVADDAPGLFARIGEALVAHDIDVVSAHAFCRARADGRVEAVDLLWLRREPPLLPRDLSAIGAMIDGLARGAAGVRPKRSARRDEGGATRVRFEQVDGATIVTVEAVDRPGILLAMSRTIFLLRLQIVGLHAKSERGRAVDRFRLAELDGGQVSPARLLELQSAILEAVDAAHTAA